MANLLTITKKPNGYYDFVVNGNVAEIVTNDRNDMTGVGNLCHFKTANGSSIIRQQNITFGNVTLIDGSPLPVAVSMDDLIAKLASIDFYLWRDASGGGGGVDRFDELADTEPYFGNNGKVPVVNESELKLDFTDLPDVTKLDKFPSEINPGQMLVGSPDGESIVWAPVPAGANGYVQAFTYSGGAQEFNLATTANLISVVINGGLADPVDWNQVGNVLTILNYTLVVNDRIIATGVI